MSQSAKGGTDRSATTCDYRAMADAGWREIARLETAYAASQDTADGLRREVAALRARLSDPKDAALRIGRFLRRALRFRKDRPPDQTPPEVRWDTHADYARWLAENDDVAIEDRLAMRRHMLAFDDFPLISVVVPVYNPPERFFREALDSVCRQIYPFWELCIADDASSPYVEAILRDYAARDTRIRWVRRPRNGHISAATNTALTLASGTFVALLDHDDVLPDHALYEVAAEINRHPKVDLIYSDEDQIDETGRRSNAYFKSDWNAELLLGQNFVSHLGVYRRSLIERVGGMREGYEGSQDHDLALRVGDATDRARIRHIPAVLYHWRQNSGEASFSEASLDRCAAASRKAVSDHLQRQGIRGSVARTAGPSAWQRVHRVLPDPTPLVTLIVPTKDQSELLGRCLDGLLHRTDYPNLEIIVVDHESVEAATHQKLSEVSADGRVRILPYAGRFNFSAINNMAVAHARGDIVGLINNDIDVMSAHWLKEMVSHVVRPDVGAVGAKLLYADGAVQHAGVLIGHGGVAGHYGHMLPRDDPGYLGRSELSSEVSAVTAACMLVRKKVYGDVGGFDEINLPVAYNDVDFCLKLRAAGYLNIFTPYAELYHLESATRGSDQHPDKIAAFNAAFEHMQRKWKTATEPDPYYNPNLSLSEQPFSLSFPTRRIPQWAQYRSPPE